MDKSNGKINIEIHSILRDVVMNIWTVFLSVIIGVMGIYIAERTFYSPEYTSTATIAVLAKVNNSTTYTNLQISSEMADIFAKIFEQNTMKDKACEHIGSEKFDGEIVATVLPNTNLLNISVVSSSPMTAYKFINAVMEVYPEISDSVFSNAVLNVMKEPQIPHRPSNNISMKNKCIAVAACAMISLCAIFVLSIFRDTVKNEDSFRNKIDSKLIGIVVHEKKHTSFSKRKKEGLLIGESTYRSFKFTECYYKIAARLKSINYKNEDKVFSIISFGENEGKTTVASNIALALAAYGHKVLLLDMDLKKPSIYKIFEQSKNSESELHSLFSGQVSAENFKFGRYKKTNLYFALNTTSCKEYPEYVENGTVKAMIENFKKMFDYVIIDTAPMSVDSTVTDLVTMVDKSIMVVRTDVVSVCDINDAILTINEVGGSVVGCVLNNVYPEFTLFNQIGADESGYNYYKKYGYSKYNKNKYNRYAINQSGSISATEEEQ